MSSYACVRACVRACVASTSTSAHRSSHEEIALFLFLLGRSLDAPPLLQLPQTHKITNSRQHTRACACRHARAHTLTAHTRQTSYSYTWES